MFWNLQRVNSYVNFIDDFDQSKYDRIKESDDFFSLSEVVNKDSYPNSRMAKFVDTEDGDNLIYNLINENGFVKLGKYLVRLDLEVQKAFVSEQQSSDIINRMNERIPDQKTIFEFPFDYDVAELLELTEEASIPLIEAISLYEAASPTGRTLAACPSASGRTDEREQCGDLRYNYNNKAYSAKVKLEYEKFAVYFSIKAKVKNYIVGIACNPYNSGYQSISYNRCDINKRKKTCKWFKCTCHDDWQFDWSRSGIVITEGSGYDLNSDRYVTTHQAYSGTRGLQAYSVSVTLRYGPLLGGTAAQAKTLSISDNL